MIVDGISELDSEKARADRLETVLAFLDKAVSDGRLKLLFHGEWISTPPSELGKEIAVGDALTEFANSGGHPEAIKKGPML